MKIKPTAKPGRVVVELGRSEDRLLAGSPPNPALEVFKLKKILVPTDFSECSKKALQYALSFARQFNASITLLHVVQINYAGGEFGPIDFPLLETQMSASAKEQLAAWVDEEIRGRVPGEAAVRTGQPVTEIVAAARLLDIDLIIISTHGHTGLKHVLLGSVAENVVRRAPCPVLTVRENEHEFIVTQN